MNILGIESSCDETGVSVYSSTRGLLADKLHSQVSTHAEYGGVVPELASRDHVRRLAALTQAALQEAGLQRDELDAIAYTSGPGLVGALLVGASYARAMAQALNIPALGVHHMEGHLLAPMLESPAPQPPYVALLVSGGHTMLVDVAAIGDYQEIGNTLDDAAGEAFDKTAKLLDLGYPGGPAIAALAEHGDDQRFRFPRPMTDRPGLEFSFSGLKTFTRTLYQQHGQHDAQVRADIAAGFERAVAETLTIKCRRALQQTGRRQLIIAGGVGANQRLRRELQQMCDKLQARLYCPRLQFCTDNGAMIAHAGAVRMLAGQRDADAAIRVRARWPLQELPNLEASA